MKSSENSRTIEAYEAGAKEYASATKDVIDGPLRYWLDASVDGLPADVRIFEIGSGTGRDALYLKSLGYSVECSDATYAFLDQLRTAGLDADYFDITETAFTDRFDLILADAVLLHFTKAQIPDILRKIYEGLKDGGRFAATLKEGVGDGWVNNKLNRPRYFCYWTEEEISFQLHEVGFTDISVTKSGPANARWLNIIAS